MKLPRSFEAGPHRIRVKHSDQLEDYGQFDYDKLLVLINENVDAGVQFETVCHEAVESWNVIAELNLPHRTIQTLGAFMAQFIKSAK